MQAFVFETYLVHDKKVIRELEVPEDFNLYKLAEESKKNMPQKHEPSLLGI